MDLKPDEIRILEHLVNRGGQTFEEISNVASVADRVLDRMLQRLRKRGLLSYEYQTYRRRRLWRITTEGRATLESAS